MKFTTSQILKIDQQIEKLYDLTLPNSAFKRVIPTNIMNEMRELYIESLQKKKQQIEQENEMLSTSRSESTQFVKVNIAALREAGYCCCPEELAAQCEELIRNQEATMRSENTEELNVLTNNIPSIGKNLTFGAAEAEVESDTDTSDEKSAGVPSTTSKVEAILAKKNFPKKEANTEFKKSKASSSKRTTKRKYFTKYMSDEFSKDTKPVDMSMMDSKTQDLFQTQDFNELVSDITGIN
eukprot:CAMPEP_0196999830 /NCGR_PEP_ID=MMETSP1380-20130617/4911_1 /TAXON_ID=5936 /ORGANISM="Euplotes crassus, Strain CT5" /LENGTH=238 /DNA_ID=CAMNT_0042416897 /DNA_START=63 /DNA_END=779 /DNA_ORIENTATION=+